MKGQIATPDRPSILALLFAIAALKLLLHLAINLWGGYEIFRDELYYLACADHLAWGYVDQPPLSIFLLAGIRAVIGDSLFALRLVPAVAGAALVFVTGLLAREMGGGRFAVGAGRDSLAARRLGAGGLIDLLDEHLRPAAGGAGHVLAGAAHQHRRAPLVDRHRPDARAAVCSTRWACCGSASAWPSGCC